MPPDTTAPHAAPEGVDHRRTDPTTPGARILALIFGLAGAGYLAWRATTFHPDAPVFSGLLFAAELAGFVSTLLTLFVTWRLTVRDAPRPDARLLVDVLVVADRQPIAEIRRTLSACRRLRYPHATWLLDEANLAEREELAAELGVQYASRGALGPQGLPRRARGDAVAVFGADHVPSRDFLDRTLGYLRDARVGFVATPLETYNLDAFEHRFTRDLRLLRSDRTVLNRILQRGRDARNAVIAPGSGVVYRRAALDALPAARFDARDEDLEKSLQLHSDGWRGVYHAETLAYRAAPDTLGAFVDARARQHRHAGRAFAFARPGLSRAQRLVYLALALDGAGPWRKLLYYATPVVVFATGWLPVASVTAPLVLLSLLHHGLGLLVYEEACRGYGRVFEGERHSLLRLSVALAAWRRGVRRPPGSREAARRLLLPQSGLAAANAVAIPLGLAEGLSHARSLDTKEIALSVSWAGMNALLATRTVSGARNALPARRRDYRFPIALPAMLNSADTRLCTGVVDQVSATGLRYFGVLPRRLSPGEFITGQILLPTGPHPFLAEVQRVHHATHGAPVPGIGASFIWPVPAAGDALTNLVYGTDLQWRLHRFAERGTTPLERLRMPARPEAGSDRARGDWAAALCRTLDDADGVCPGIVTLPDATHGERTLVLYRRLLSRLPLRLRATSRHGIRDEEGLAELFDAFWVEGVALYVYRFRPVRSPGAKRR